MLSDLVAWFQNLFGSEPSPQEKLERAQMECRDKLQDLKQAIADVTTQKKKLELQRNRLQSEVARQTEEAEQKVNEGYEESARDILKHKRRNQERIDELQEQIDKMSDIQTNLTQQKDSLERELRDIQTTQSNIKARKKAAEAEMMASEAFSDVDGVDVDDTLTQLQRRTERLESRAEVARNSPDSFFEEEMNQSDEEIEKELEELKN